MNNFIIIVLDGVGIGELPDANKYNDTGSNTLANLAINVGGLKLPNLEKLGLGNISEIKGIKKQENPLASFGKMNELSTGKDSTSGHWELGGLKVDFDFPTYPDGFSNEIIDAFINKTGVKGILGNKTASGTSIIEELGDEHVKTGYPIVYTSADSVFQIAAHEDVIDIQKQYEICRIARNEVLTGKDAVGRVIARPFIGNSGNYKRTTNRSDFSVDPAGDTILDILSNEGIRTIAIGKVNDLFNYRGIQIEEKTKSNFEGIKKIVEYSSNENGSFIFANLVDFDVYFGHRLDPKGFANCLSEFDYELPVILETLHESDVLILTADHGNDPTVKSTDHTREYVPLLYFSKNRKGVNLGVRDTFSDVAQTAAHFFKINNGLKGTSFLND